MIAADAPLAAACTKESGEECCACQKHYEETGEVRRARGSFRLRGGSQEDK